MSIVGTEPLSGMKDIPSRGLIEVLSSWALAGSMTSVETLNAALGAVTSIESRKAWSAAQVARRAERMAWERVRPVLMQLPEDEDAWLDAIPGASHHSGVWSERPVPPVDWRASVRASGGWPPPNPYRARFRRQRRARLQDDVATRALSWGRYELRRVRDAASGLGASVPESVSRRIEALPKGGQLQEPSRSDIQQLRGLGSPFRELTQVLEVLLTLSSDPIAYAHDLLAPDEEVRWRLFQLGCYGEVIAEAVDRIGAVTSRTPLFGGSGWASHSVADPHNPAVEYQFWFEAGGIWRAYGGATQRHRRLGSIVRGSSGDLRPDIGGVILVDGKPRRAAVLEVKYSEDGGYVFGTGYPQAIGYGLEMASGFESSVLALTIGPDPVLLEDKATNTSDVFGRQLHAGVARPAAAAKATIGWLKDAALD